MKLFFDTETTGIARFNLPPEHPTQPHIVQLGAILADDNRRVVAEMNLLVKPEGWTIPPEAAAVHGISTELAAASGLRVQTVVKLFMQLVLRADLIVAHNLDFDRMLVMAELARMAEATDLDLMRNRSGFCTMRAATPIMRIPGRAGYKWPNLREAYAHFVGGQFEGAHDAMADVRACRSVYYGLQAPAPQAAGGAS